ncbi:MAG: hypothetical protein LBS31_07295 [Candidatus Adiutrix sp.]|jgi:hypothetical protein|nr:hypothetical protein [Candidatus Adiutrix sp.]
MQYYAFDDQGFFAGAGQAEPGDVPGSFIMPHNSTTTPPPEGAGATAPPGQYRLGPGGAWLEATIAERAALRRAGIEAELARLDAKGVRAVMAINAGTGTAEDLAWLQKLEGKKAALRRELAALDE